MMLKWLRNTHPYKRVDWEHLECTRCGKQFSLQAPAQNVLSAMASRVENRRSDCSLPVAFDKVSPRHRCPG